MEPRLAPALSVISTQLLLFIVYAISSASAGPVPAVESLGLASVPPSAGSATVISIEEVDPTSFTSSLVIESILVSSTLIAPSTIPSSTAASTLKLTTPIIVGSAVAGAIGVFITILLAIFFLRKYQRSRDVDVVQEQAHFPVQSPRHMIQSGLGNQPYSPYAFTEYSDLKTPPRAYAGYIMEPQALQTKGM